MILLLARKFYAKTLGNYYYFHSQQTMTAPPKPSFNNCGGLPYAPKIANLIPREEISASLSGEKRGYIKNSYAMTFNSFLIYTVIMTD